MITQSARQKRKMISSILEASIRREVKEKNVALLLSGGVDSMSLGFAASRVGKHVVAYSFKTDQHDSYDYEKAQQVSETMGWDFVGVVVNTEDLKKDFYKLLDLGCVKKTQFECTYPFLHLYPEIVEHSVLSGIAADGWYGLSKKAKMNFIKTKESFDGFRREYFNAENPAGVLNLLSLSSIYNKKLVHPYLWDKKVEHYFMEYDWNELNKPEQKRHVREAFKEEFEMVGHVNQHTNLQLDSKINILFESLLDDLEINFKDRSRVMDVCRDWAGLKEFHDNN